MSIRIFVTTDNHVGYNETDPVQGNDAAAAFDEAMTIAQREAVDFVIQGGDLFHVTKPSKRALYAVLRTLRRTCLGDRPVEFCVLNHGALAPGDAPELDYPNFEDADMNVALPVFAISGNHDDAGGAAGAAALSPLDVVGAAGLLNHFGRVHDSAQIVVKPVLIAKGGVRVALYGLASVRDERLYRTFRDNHVTFLRPREDPDSYFSILVVHQNRSAHGPTNFLPEEFLPSFIDLVIWGHEHECRIDPEPSAKGFRVMQPGSTVCTSLSGSETLPKHVAILAVGENKSFSYEKIRLRTVRPFAMRTVSLHEQSGIDPRDRDARAKVTQWLSERVDELIDETRLEWKEQHGDDIADEDVPLPLVRLRVEYTGYEVENAARFSNRFAGRVANTTNVLHLIKRRGDAARPGSRLRASDSVSDDPAESGIKQVEQLLHEKLASRQLAVLSEQKMSEALSQFVEKDNRLALKVSVDSTVQSKVSDIIAGLAVSDMADAGAAHVAAPADSAPDYATPAQAPFIDPMEELEIVADSDEDEPVEAPAAEPKAQEPAVVRAPKPSARRASRSARPTRASAKPSRVKPAASASRLAVASPPAPRITEDDDSDGMFSSD